MIQSNLHIDEAIEARIDQGIEGSRRGGGVVRVTDAAGNPVPGVRLELEQTSSDFLFGANVFMLGGYPDAVLNRRYEDAFTGLFNAATAPFFWKELEPRQGVLRFGADSAPIARRPASDIVADFCERHGLAMKGHCLVWDYRPWSLPDWLYDPARSEQLFEQRNRQIGERYGAKIPYWDVLNEPLSRFNLPENVPDIAPMPDNFEGKAFTWAQKYLPDSAKLIINETTPTSWDAEFRDGYIGLIKRLISEGAKIDRVGLQWHVFNPADIVRLLSGELHSGNDLLGALDDYQPLGLPLHVSEITLPAVDASAQAQQDQADLARYYYRLWFSHPSVEGIYWWNLPDGAGVAGHEATLKSGLLNPDLSPKPAYEVLQDLIQNEWRTRVTVTTDEHGAACFHGFYGDYQVRFNNQKWNFNLKFDQDFPIEIVLQ